MPPAARLGPWVYVHQGWPHPFLVDVRTKGPWGMAVGGPLASGAVWFGPFGR